MAVFSVIQISKFRFQGARVRRSVAPRDQEHTGDDLSESIPSSSSTSAASILLSRLLHLGPQEVGGDILIGSVLAQLVLVLEALDVRLGEDEGVLDCLVGVVEVVLARKALVGGNVALQEKPHLPLLRMEDHWSAAKVRGRGKGECKRTLGMPFLSGSLQARSLPISIGVSSSILSQAAQT